jgi:hypothetical protein
MGSEKDEDVKKLVRLIDPDNRNEEWLKTLFKNVTKVEESEQKQFLNEINVDVVVALYYPVYDQCFTHDEIKELIRFYSSEAGIKLTQYKGGNHSVHLMPNELDRIEQFKKTGTGKKYDKLLGKIVNQHSDAVKRYIDSLR